MAAPFVPRPSPLVVASGRWRSGLLAAHVPAAQGGFIADWSYCGRSGDLAGSAIGGLGPYGPHVAVGTSGGTGAGRVTFAAPSPLLGTRAGTVAVLARLDSAAGSSGGSGLCDLASYEGSTAADVIYRLTYYQPGPGIYWQPGPDGSAWQIGPFTRPALGEWTLYVGRLMPTSATAGEVSLWYGASRQGASTFTGATFGTSAGVGAAFGGSGSLTDREWNGDIAAHYVWSRALADGEIAALALDPFAPVRPRGTFAAVANPPSFPWAPVSCLAATETIAPQYED